MERKRILIVKGDPYMSELYVELLKSEGYDIEVVSDGESALQKLTNNYYDFICLDIIIPKKDGLKVLKEFRETGKPQGKIVIFSNFGQKEIISEAFSLGVDGYEILSELFPARMPGKIKGYLDGTITKEQSKNTVMAYVPSHAPPNTSNADGNSNVEKKQSS